MKLKILIALTSLLSLNAFAKDEPCELEARIAVQELEKSLDKIKGVPSTDTGRNDVTLTGFHGATAYEDYEGVQLGSIVVRATVDRYQSNRTINTNIYMMFFKPENCSLSKFAYEKSFSFKN